MTMTHAAVFFIVLGVAPFVLCSKMSKNAYVAKLEKVFENRDPAQDLADVSAFSYEHFNRIVLAVNNVGKNGFAHLKCKNDDNILFVMYCFVFNRLFSLTGILFQHFSKILLINVLQFQV